MHDLQPKKFLILNILSILNRHTDEQNRLSQKEISDKLLWRTRNSGILGKNFGHFKSGTGK